MNKILIFGYGNIVKKNIKYLKKIDQNFTFFIVVKNYQNYKDSKNIKILKSFNNIDLKKFKYILISSPANTHIKYLKYFYDKKIRIFIEKPLDVNPSLVSNFLKKKY